MTYTFGLDTFGDRNSDADGRPLSSKEVVVIINLNKLGTAGISNVTVRGVEEAAFQLRPQVRIVQGRMFRWGAREVIAGAGITNRFVGAQIGEQVKFGGDLWTVVGIFDAEGSGFDSELWGDLNQIADVFKRQSLSTVTLRLKNPDEFAEVIAAFEADNRLQYFAPKREKKFFEEQSEMMATFIRILGIWPRLRAMAGPAPDIHEPEPESESLKLISVPADTDVSNSLHRLPVLFDLSKYQDLLHVLLEYVAEVNIY